MIPDRYPAPHANSIFSADQRIVRWFGVMKQYARHAIQHDPRAEGDRDRLYAMLGELNIPHSTAVRTRELNTGHDVVAFLSLIEQQAPLGLRRYLHYGLTSSDLVDNAHFDGLRAHAETLANMVAELEAVLASHYKVRVPRPGRTHGQIAALTTWGHQMEVQVGVLVNIRANLRIFAFDHLRKSTGPTGTSDFVRPLPGYYNEVVPSTQVIPRDYQLQWACLYLRLACQLETLALLVRTGARAEIREVREGAERVGSSSMPHKKNPIDSEKVCGMARIARGLFVAISENGALWDDRDISNSSVERYAVPDLAATVEHMIATMGKVMRNLIVNEARMVENARDPQTASHVFQVMAQKHFGMGPVEAAEFVRSVCRFDGIKVDIEDDNKSAQFTDWIVESRSWWHNKVGF